MLFGTTELVAKTHEMKYVVHQALAILLQASECKCQSKQFVMRKALLTSGKSRSHAVSKDIFKHFIQTQTKMPIETKPAPIGVELRGIDLSLDISQDLIEQFKKDVHTHRLLIFKNQGKITGQRHVEISKWFGELESTFYKHPKSPHPDVFRVSNVRDEGCTNVGRTGWHIDGSFMEKPFAFSLYYMEAVPRTGDTG